MDAELIRWLLTGLMGIVLWFGRTTMESNKKLIEVLQTDVQNLKDTRLHKDDFREFKLELRGQFEEVKQAIRDLKPHAE